VIILEIDGREVTVEEGTTVLEAANLLGIDIPTICYDKDLSPYGACRLCVVEIGEEPRTKMVSSCTYPAEKGLKVKTNSPRVENARKMILELYLALSPDFERIKDLAAKYGVYAHRFKQKYEDCILCGLCVRKSGEKKLGRIIAFRGRGDKRSVGAPYGVKSDECRPCGRCVQKELPSTS